MKVLHITNNDYDGAGQAVMRLHNALIDIGVESTVALLFNKHNDANILKICYSNTLKGLLLDVLSLNILLKHLKYMEFFHFVKLKILEKFYLIYYKPKYLFNFNSLISRYGFLKKYISGYDVIVIHSVQGVLLPKDIYNMHREFKVKIIMRPLDMELITGGCHFNYECNKWTEDCNCCPQLNSKHGKNAIAAFTILNKKSCYKNIPIQWIAANNYVAKKIKSSSVVSDCHNFSTVYLGVNKDRCKYITKNKAREFLGLPINKKIILFGCLNFSDERKGAKYLKTALMNNIERLSCSNVLLVTFGETNNFSFGNLDIDWIHLGSVYDDSTMNALYRASDLLVSPSVDDLGPVTVVEAFMNNLRIVAFDLGVAQDLVLNNINGNIVERFDVDKFGDMIYKNISSLLPNFKENKDIINLQKKQTIGREAATFKIIFDK